MKERYFSDFKLGKHKLSDFGGIRYNPNGEISTSETPSPRHTTLELPGVNGEQYFRTVYDSRLITFPVYIEGDIDIDRLRAWLCKDGQQTFCYIGENGELDYKEIDVVFNKGISFLEYWDDTFKGTTELEFIAHNPLWRVRNEENIVITNTILNKENNFKTKTSIKCRPLIKVVPEGTQSIIRFMFNNLIITLKNVNKEIYIDSENGEVYEIDNGIKVNMFSKYFSNGWMELPEINPFEYNKLIVIEGTVNRFEITPNSRIL